MPSVWQRLHSLHLRAYSHGVSGTRQRVYHNSFIFDLANMWIKKEHLRGWFHQTVWARSNMMELWYTHRILFMGPEPGYDVCRTTNTGPIVSRMWHRLSTSA